MLKPLPFRMYYYIQLGQLRDVPEPGNFQNLFIPYKPTESTLNSEKTGALRCQQVLL